MIKHSHHIAAPIPEHVYSKVQALIQQAKQEGTADLDTLLGVIAELTNTGLDFYFLNPLRRMGAGGMTLKAAEMGVHSTQKGINLVIRKVVQRLEGCQLVAITGFLEEIMHAPEA